LNGDIHNEEKKEEASNKNLVLFKPVFPNDFLSLPTVRGEGIYFSRANEFGKM